MAARIESVSRQPSHPAVPVYVSGAATRTGNSVSGAATPNATASQSAPRTPASAADDVSSTAQHAAPGPMRLPAHDSIINRSWKTARSSCNGRAVEEFQVKRQPCAQATDTRPQTDKEVDSHRRRQADTDTQADTRTQTDSQTRKLADKGTQTDTHAHKVHTSTYIDIPRTSTQISHTFSCAQIHIHSSPLTPPPPTPTPPPPPLSPLTGS